DASPIAQSPEYVPESDFEPHPEDDDDEDPLPSASRREDRPEVTLPPQKRLDIALGPRYEREREIGYGIADSWDEIVKTLQGAPVSTDTELGRYVREFETRVRQDTDEIYMRLDDDQTERQLLAGRLNMLFRDRRAHAYTHQLMETEARMSREGWVRATDASDLFHGEVMSLRTTVLGQMSEIRELQAADRRRQTVISELLRIDHRRSTEILELRTSLQGQKQIALRRTSRSTTDQETVNATTVTNAQLHAMIDQGVTAALAARDALGSFLVETDTKSEPFKDPIKTETPESPHTLVSLTSLPYCTPPTRHAKESEDSDTSGTRSTPSDFTALLSPDYPPTYTTPILVPLLYRTARMAVRVPPAVSHGLSASIAEVAAMFDSAFCKRFRSSYESLPSSSPPDLPLRKRSRGTSEFVEDDEEDDDEEEDEEVEKSSDSNSEREDAKDDGPTTEDKGPTAGNEGPAARDEGGNEAVPEGQRRAAPVVKTAIGKPLGLGYEALRRREIASREGQMPSVFKVGQNSRSIPEPERPKRVLALRQPTLTTWIDLEDGRVYIDVLAYPLPATHVLTPPSPEWLSGSLPGSPAPSIVPSPISSPMIPLTVPWLVASPATTEAEGFLTELGAQVEMQRGLIHDQTI
nr:hypothetical protein [Tanacetum cinerariifolium]